jgi:hypothetical protein
MITYGTMDAKPGDQCSNSPWIDYFTTPCCYQDVEDGTTECPSCGAPIECRYEQQPVAICTIRDPEDDD